MTLYDKDDADWYLVKVKSGEIGLAPSNYIRQVCVCRTSVNQYVVQTLTLLSQ